MRSIKIDLAQPFEEVLATVLSLPAGCSNTGDNRLENDVGLKQAIRGLHEAANGRLGEKKNGRVAVAPPIAAFLKIKPFHVATQVDFLIAAATRIICGPPRFDVGMRTARNADETSRAAPALLERTQGRPPDRRAFPQFKPRGQSVEVSPLARASFVCISKQ